MSCRPRAGFAELGKVKVSADKLWVRKRNAL